MKKLFLVSFLGVILLSYGVYDFLKKSPGELYKKAIHGKIHSKWYANKNLVHLLRPTVLTKDFTGVSQPHLWKKMAIGDFKFPIPYRHPLYRVRPLFPREGDKRLGISFLNNQKVELVKIFIEPSFYFVSKRPKMKFYDIPIVDYWLDRYSGGQVWKDLFLKDIPDKLGDWEQGVRHLYLLEQRERFFPEKVLAFGVLKDNEQVKYWQLDEKDRDYKHERFLVRAGERLFSFTLSSRFDDEVASVFRDYIISHFKLVFDKEKNSEMIHAEFRNLSFEDKSDEIGFLQIYSAWTQDPSNKFFLREMIYYLEKNPHLVHLLKETYHYTLWRYQQLFAFHEKIEGQLEGRLLLQRKIELEEKKYLKERLEIKEYMATEKDDNQSLIKEKLRRGRNNFKQRKNYRIN